MQWIAPHQRAKAVSLTTSGMYLGSAAAMLILPSVAAVAGPAALAYINLEINRQALFIAYHILGRPTDGLLDHFRWADEFLRLNNLSG